MRNGLAVEITVALIMLFSSVLTVIIEKENDNVITKIVYQNEDIPNCVKKSDTIRERD